MLNNNKNPTLRSLNIWNISESEFVQLKRIDYLTGYFQNQKKSDWWLKNIWTIHRFAAVAYFTTWHKRISSVLKLVLSNECVKLTSINCMASWLSIWLFLLQGEPFRLIKSANLSTQICPDTNTSDPVMTQHRRKMENTWKSSFIRIPNWSKRKWDNPFTNRKISVKEQNLQLYEEPFATHVRPVVNVCITNVEFGLKYKIMS